MNMFKLEACVYQLVLEPHRSPYVGQSRALDRDRLPTKRWKCHIADSKKENPNMLYVHRAIRAKGLTYNTLDKSVLEYVEHVFPCNKEILSNILSKENKLKYKKYITILNKLLLQADTHIGSEEINEYIETEENLTEEELHILQQVDIFVNKTNAAEEKWVISKNSMMPDRGGNGYNDAPPGGVFLHEPHTEEHKAYMSTLMKGRKLTDTTKELLRTARFGKPLSETHKKILQSVARRRFNDVTFPNGVNKWKQLYNKIKRPPKSNSEDFEEKQVAEWRQSIIKKKSNDINNRSSFGLTDEQISILEELPGWTWCTDTFYEQFENFKRQYELHNGKLNTSKKDAENPDKGRAINWIRRIRSMKKENDPNLTEEHVSLLNNCEYWTWESTTFTSFDESVSKWAEFYSRNKRQPSMGSKDIAEKKLARWQSKTRIDYHDEHPRLTKEKIDELNSIHGWTWKG